MNDTEMLSFKIIILCSLASILFVCLVGYNGEPPGDKPVSCRGIMEEAGLDSCARNKDQEHASVSEQWVASGGGDVSYVFKPYASNLIIRLLFETEVSASGSMPVTLEINIKSEGKHVLDFETIKKVVNSLGIKYIPAKVGIIIEGFIEKQQVKVLAEELFHAVSQDPK